MAEPRVRRFATRLLFILIVLMLAACSGMRHFEWTEDVRLSDGRIIVVQRSEDRRRVVSPGDGFKEGWLFKNSTIATELPGPVNRKAVWEGGLVPIALEVQKTGTAYLVGLLGSGAAQDEWKVADGEYYVALLLTEQGWRRIPLVELPPWIKPNLLANVRALFLDRGANTSGTHVNLELKEKLDSDPRLDRHYKSITAQ